MKFHVFSSISNFVKNLLEFSIFDFHKRSSVQIPKIFISPTDTIPGIFCQLKDETSAKEIYRIKGRTFHKPLAIYSSNPKKLFVHSYLIKEFLEVFEGKPITIVAKPSKNLSKFAIRHGFIGVRILSESSSMLQFLKENHITLLGTSANKSNAPSPQNLAEVDPYLTNSLPILEFEENPLQQNTSVIKFVENKIVILREGLFFEEILTWILEKGGSLVLTFEDGEEKNAYIINI